MLIQSLLSGRLIGIYGDQRLGQVFPKRSFAFPFIVRPNHPQHMLPTCRSAKMTSVAYRLKTRVVLRDHGQQRTPSQSYSSFSHELAFNFRPSSTPNSATLEAIQRAQRIESNKPVRASTDAFQIRASLPDPVASSCSPSAIEVLVRLDQINKSTKPVGSSAKITGKLIQVWTWVFDCHARLRRDKITLWLTVFSNESLTGMYSWRRCGRA